MTYNGFCPWPHGPSPHFPFLYCPINQVGQTDRTREEGTRDDDDDETKQGGRNRVSGVCVCVGSS